MQDGVEMEGRVMLQKVEYLGERDRHGRGIGDGGRAVDERESDGWERRAWR